MPRIAGEPLIKVTLNLYEKDVDYLKERKGWGYTEVIRELIHREIRLLNQIGGRDVKCPDCGCEFDPDWES